MIEARNLTERYGESPTAGSHGKVPLVNGQPVLPAFPLIVAGHLLNQGDDAASIGGRPARLGKVQCRATSRRCQPRIVAGPTSRCVISWPGEGPDQSCRRTRISTSLAVPPRGEQSQPFGTTAEREVDQAQRHEQPSCPAGAYRCSTTTQRLWHPA
jgi:hypothetical protein